MKIMFVCLGNICRSPMAEMIMKELVREKGLEHHIVIASAGISDEEEGNDIYPPAKKKLIEKKIPVEKRKAKKLTQADIEFYDYIVVMEKYQRNRILKNYIILDRSKLKNLNEKDIEDPWYTNNFELAYQEIYDGCERLLREIEKVIN